MCQRIEKVLYTCQSVDTILCKIGRARLSFASDFKGHPRTRSGRICHALRRWERDRLEDPACTDTLRLATPEDITSTPARIHRSVHRPVWCQVRLD